MHDVREGARRQTGMRAPGRDPCLSPPINQAWPTVSHHSQDGKDIPCTVQLRNTLGWEGRMGESPA